MSLCTYVAAYDCTGPQSDGRGSIHAIGYDVPPFGQVAGGWVGRGSSAIAHKSGRRWQDFEQIVLIPASFEAFTPNAGLPTFILKLRG